MNLVRVARGALLLMALTFNSYVLLSHDSGMFSAATSVDESGAAGQGLGLGAALAAVVGYRTVFGATSAVGWAFP